MVVVPVDGVEKSKRLAAWTAVDNHVFPEHKVVYSVLPFHLALIERCRSLGLAQVCAREFCCGIKQSFRLATGSTVPYVVERILAQGSSVNKDRVFIPTGRSGSWLLYLQ